MSIASMANVAFVRRADVATEAVPARAAPVSAKQMNWQQKALPIR